MKGRRPVKEVFLSLETIEMYSVCVPFRGWMGKTDDLSAFERGMVCGRCTGLCQELQRCWVSLTQQFPICIKHGPPPQRTSSQLDTIVGSIRVNMGQHICGTRWHLIDSMPWLIEAVLKAKGGATQYSEGVPNVRYTQCISVGSVLFDVFRF
jgi:hypothetical protein